MANHSFPTRTELQVLAILRDSPEGLSGLQIVKRGIARGSVYILLSRLEDKGFVTVDRNEPAYPGLNRSHYRISGEGRRVVAFADDLSTAVRV